MLCAQWVANAGDSRAVLGTRDGPRSMISVTALTEDQKPDLPKEEERILKCGGYVSHASPQFGPPRVWLGQGEGAGRPRWRVPRIGIPVDDTVQK